MTGHGFSLPTDQDELKMGGDEANVFLSYSRKDRERAQRIADVLRERHFGVFKDTDDILPTEEWKERLEQLIAEADTVVFLLSPQSADSEVCAWEVEHAAALNKRIAPIVIEETDGKDIPPLLARLNFIFCTERDRFEDAVDSLVSALNVDIEWIREHTRLASLAERWRNAGKPARLLLRGQDIADAEAWREEHPKDAPAVTPLQAEVISESRRAAVRRQRSWAVGSLGVAAATIALSIFAWFQSIEADRQRAEAEIQRSIAEENAAEAARQRDVAEEQRRDALRRLAASRMITGDRAGAFAILSETDPDSPTTAALAAGLQPADGLLDEVPEGAPFMLNAGLYLKQEDGAVKLPVYPAAWHAPAGDRFALISETGALWLHGQDGSLAGQSIPSRATKPCFVDRAAEGRLTLFSVYSAGYSACSLGFAATEVTLEGVGEPGFLGVCSDASLDIASRPDNPVPIADFAEECIKRLKDAPPPDTISGIESAEGLRPIKRYSFPAARDEGSLWRNTQRQDGISVTAHLIGRLRRWEGLPAGKVEDFGIMQYQGEDASDWIMPDTAMTEHLSAIAALTVWGGTGGEAHAVCHGPRGAGLSCAEFHTFSGFGGIRLDRNRPSLLLYGNGLTNEKSGVGPHNAWVSDALGEALKPLQDIDAFGTVQDAAFAPDGRIALLTENAILLLAADRSGHELMSRPLHAGAVEWLASGGIVVLEDTGLLHFAREGGGFDTLKIDNQWMGLLKKPNGAPLGVWLRADASGKYLAAGTGKYFHVYDTALRAPITGLTTLPDPQVSDAEAGFAVNVTPEGYVQITVNGRYYRRLPPAKDLDRSALVDPDAPLRLSD